MNKLALLTVTKDIQSQFINFKTSHREDHLYTAMHHGQNDRRAALYQLACEDGSFHVTF